MFSIPSRPHIKVPIWICGIASCHYNIAREINLVVVTLLVSRQNVPSFCRGTSAWSSWKMLEMEAKKVMRLQGPQITLDKYFHGRIVNCSSSCSSIQVGGFGRHLSVANVINLAIQIQKTSCCIVAKYGLRGQCKIDNNMVSRKQAFKTCSWWLKEDQISISNQNLQKCKVPQQIMYCVYWILLRKLRLFTCLCSSTEKDPSQ